MSRSPDVDPQLMRGKGNRDHRAADRHPIALAGVLRPSGSTQLKVDLLDLSCTGFRCQYFFDLEIGERVWLKFAELAALEAEVVRREGYLYGFCFIQPLYQAVLDHIIAVQKRR